jgi:hypothetical protein
MIGLYDIALRKLVLGRNAEDFCARTLSCRAPQLLLRTIEADNDSLISSEVNLTDLCMLQQCLLL